MDEVPPIEERCPRLDRHVRRSDGVADVLLRIASVVLVHGRREVQTHCGDDARRVRSASADALRWLRRPTDSLRRKRRRNRLLLRRALQLHAWCRTEPTQQEPEVDREAEQHIVDSVATLVGETERDAVMLATALSKEIAAGVLEVETNGRRIVLRVKEHGTLCVRLGIANEGFQTSVEDHSRRAERHAGSDCGRGSYRRCADFDVGVSLESRAVDLASDQRCARTFRRRLRWTNDGSQSRATPTRVRWFPTIRQRGV